VSRFESPPYCGSAALRTFPIDQDTGSHCVF
jgi:hypothetical protein